jgi:hypothetical protein
MDLAPLTQETVFSTDTPLPLIMKSQTERVSDMAKLPKFTLAHNEKKDRWELKNDQTDQVVKSFDTKEVSTQGGVLRKAVGPYGGSVKIKTLDGKFQEERTYPRSADPRRSKG